MSQSTLPRPGTAIVTGASSGIGAVYAERLAARDHDLVLVARREERLRTIAADLTARFGIEAEILVVDLSTPAGVAAVAARIEHDEAVSLLVNNAGFSAHKPLTETPDDLATRMIALNVMAPTLLSKAALAAFKRRGAGALVNLGSGAGVAPYPGIPVYGATKAYAIQFTQSLQSEVEGTDVRIQLVLPGAVVSEGWDVAEFEIGTLPDGIVMTTEDCVDAALAGLDAGERVTAPSLEDAARFQAHEAEAATLMQAMFDRRPATRYGLAR